MSICVVTNRRIRRKVHVISRARCLSRSEGICLARNSQRLRTALQEAGIPVDRFRALTHCERWDFVMSASCRNMQAVAAIYHRRIIRFGLLLAPL